MRQLPGERVVRVVEAAAELGERREVEVLAEQTVHARVERQPYRLLVRQPRRRQTEHRAHRPRHGLDVVAAAADELRGQAAEVAVELLPERGRLRRRAVELGEQRVLGRRLERDRVLEHRGEVGVVRERGRDHRLHHPPGLGGNVELPAEPPVAEQRQARDRVQQRGVRRHREHRPRDLLRLALGLPGEPLRVAAPVREARQQLRLGDRREQLDQPPVRLVLRRHRRGERGRRRSAQVGDEHVVRRHLHVALRHLLRVRERVGVQERPDELPAHPLHHEQEVGVLERRVMACDVQRAGERVAPLPRRVPGLARRPPRRRRPTPARPPRPGEVQVRAAATAVSSGCGNAATRRTIGSGAMTRHSTVAIHDPRSTTDGFALSEPRAPDPASRSLPATGHRPPATSFSAASARMSRDVR